MRVGLLTFHDAINYGAVLQAVALSRSLTKVCNEQCTLLDYRCKSIDQMYRIKEGNLAKRLLKAGYQTLKRNSFRKFVKYNCQMTGKLDEQSINQYADCFDAWVVGSDQVWNGNITGHDSNFLLEFVGDCSRKLSYAASFGNYQIPVQEVPLFQKALESFDGISVREPAGAEAIKDITNLNVDVHLDPTLLLDMDEWGAMAKEPKIKNKYIFIYASGDVSKIAPLAKRISKETGMKILYMGNYNIPNGRKLSFVSPEAWLGYIKNASCVLTNSFHGTAFSIIFNRHFFVDLGKTEVRNGTEMHHNDRAENLINTLGLQNRAIDCVDKQLNQAPDWDVRNKVLPIYKDKALEYLRRTLNA